MEEPPQGEELRPARHLLRTVARLGAVLVAPAIAVVGLAVLPGDPPLTWQIVGALGFGLTSALAAFVLAERMRRPWMPAERSSMDWSRGLLGASLGWVVIDMAVVATEVWLLRSNHPSLAPAILEAGPAAGLVGNVLIGAAHALASRAWGPPRLDRQAFRDSLRTVGLACVCLAPLALVGLGAIEALQLVSLHWQTLAATAGACLAAGEWYVARQRRNHPEDLQPSGRSLLWAADRCLDLTIGANTIGVGLLIAEALDPSSALHGGLPLGLVVACGAIGASNLLATVAIVLETLAGRQGAGVDM